MASSNKRPHREAAASPNKRPKVEVYSDDDSYYMSSDVSEEYDEEDDWEATQQRNSPKKKASPAKKQAPKAANVKVASKAEVLSLATDTPLGAQSASERLAAVDEAVIERIKKALKLGSHEGTGEAEAKAAMRVASKLMAQHNVDQADVLAAEDDAEKLKRAGQSTVAIRSTSHARVISHSWSSAAAHAMDTFFNCKSYSTLMNYRIDWTFYGLAEQTVAAAYAYEMVYNLILTWSAQSKIAKGRTGKNNYCLGVAEGLYQLAKQEQKEEERRAIKKEKARLEAAKTAEEEERKRAVERLAGPDPIEEKKGVKVEEVPDHEDVKPVKVEDVPDVDLGSAAPDPESNIFGDDSESESDGDHHPGGWDQGYADEHRADFNDDDDLDDMLRDLDTTGHIKTKPDPSPPPKPEPKPQPPIIKVEDEDDTPWASGQQLTLFRNNALSIADEYLEQSKIKVHKGPKLRGPNFTNKGDRAVYKQGKEDAKKIDVKRKRIKDAEQD